ncbi:MAG: HipA-like protein, partial [Phormidesmis sp.]
MSNRFPIFEVPSDAAEAIEVMGTKPKFWFDHSQFGKCLFKQARSNTGEDWSEKIAAELAQLLKLPCARKELAIYKGNPGTI